MNLLKIFEFCCVWKLVQWMTVWWPLCRFRKFCYPLNTSLDKLELHRAENQFSTRSHSPPSVCPQPSNACRAPVTCLGLSTTVLTWHEPKRAEPGVFSAQPGWRSQNPALPRSAPQWANIWSRSTLNMFGWPELLGLSCRGKRDSGAEWGSGSPWQSRTRIRREREAASQQWSSLTSCSHAGEPAWSHPARTRVRKAADPLALLLFLLI